MMDEVSRSRELERLTTDLKNMRVEDEDLQEYRQTCLKITQGEVLPSMRRDKEMPPGKGEPQRFHCLYEVAADVYSMSGEQTYYDLSTFKKASLRILEQVVHVCTLRWKGLPPCRGEPSQFHSLFELARDMKSLLFEEQSHYELFCCVRNSMFFWDTNCMCETAKSKLMECVKSMALQVK